MEITTTTTTNPNGRQATITALAVIGFVALLIVGIMLAIYSARFVPVAINRLGGAAVSLSSLFKPAEDAKLEVVVATSTLPFTESTTTVATATSTGLIATNLAGSTTPATPSTPVRGPQTTTTYPATPAVLFGQSDLTVTITQVGYLPTSDNSSFIATNNIPSGAKVAVKFTVVNKGTNATGAWSFVASIPASTSIFTSPTQQSLRPSDRVEYILGFDRPRSGSNKNIEVTVDDTNVVSESNESNNSDSVSITID